MREVVAHPRRAGVPASRLYRVQRVAYGAVTECVEMDLETLRRQRGHEAWKLLRVDEVQAAVRGAASVPVEIWLQHRGGMVLGDAVEHHLHARRPEAVTAHEAAPVEQLGQLVEPALAVPPQRTDDGRDERSVACGARVRRQRVGAVLVVTDDGVLPSGDAE